MNALKHPVVLFTAGILVGYALRRVLDNVPVINKIPAIRLG